jgi:hypothetical protein
MSQNNKPHNPQMHSSQPAQASESLDDKIARAVGKAIEETLPVTNMATAQLLANMFKPAAKPVEQFGSNEHCSDCGQLLRACGGKHVMLRVAPSNQRLWNSFPGIYINGIHYKSPDANTAIPVPAENDIEYRVNQWEESEQDLRNGRTLTHNSGILSGAGRSHVQPANPLGFRGIA